MTEDSLWSMSYHEGLKFKWKFSYSSEDVKAFGKLSKDKNPLHTNSEFAKKKGFEGQVVYGLLIASQISRLIGEELPDRNSILVGFTIDFLQPSYIDEDLTFEAELCFKSEAAKALEFRYKILNQDKLLCKGKVNSIWRE